MKDSRQVLDYPVIKQLLADECSSAISKEMALALEPMDRKEKIQEALDETMEAVQSLEREVTQPLGGTRDIRDAVKKSRKNIILSAEELWDIYNSLCAYDGMKRFFSDKQSHYPLLSLYLQDLPSEEKLKRRLERTFDEKGELQDNASPKLLQLRSTITRLRGRVRSDLQQILHDQDNQKYFQEAIVTQRNNRYVIPVKQEYRSAFPGLIHDRSSTGATLYIEPMRLVDLNNDLQETMLAEEQEVRRIFQELSREVKADAGRILDACQQVSHVEFVYGKAQLANRMKAVPATLSDDREVALINARHPLIPANVVVPITITLGTSYTILLITGSNTGGKTVSMKTLGLLALMNQSGLFIPADPDSTLPVFAHVYADIGDEQSIEESLSTFSAHMTQIGDILKVVTSRDLVLLDELGSGTDPEEGSSLAVALLDYMRQKGCLMMVSTHYNELKHYAYHTDGVENGHVEFDEQTLRPTYRLHIGVAGSSHALSIAARLGLPKSIIDEAKAHRKEQDDKNVEGMLSKLNEQLRKSSEKERILRSRLADVNKERAKVERERREIKEKKKQILDKARQDVETMKQSVRVESEQIIKDLKQQYSVKNKEKRQAAMAKARKGVSALPVPDYEEDRRPLAPEDAKPGLAVYVPSLRSVGTILSVNGKKVQVDVRGMTAAMKCSDLMVADKQEAAAARRKDQQVQPKARKRARQASAVMRQQNATTEINVIGQTVDEAVMNISAFLDSALLAGIGQVRIIHGKGTGALRAGIWDYLKKLPIVKHFEIAGYNEGGAGATVVYL